MADAAPDAAGEPKPEGAVLFKRKSRGHMKGRMRKKTKAAKVEEEEKESSSDEGEVVRKEKTKSNVHRVRPESPSRWRVLFRSGGKGAEHAPRPRARAAADAETQGGLRPSWRAARRECLAGAFRDNALVFPRGLRVLCHACCPPRCVEIVASVGWQRIANREAAPRFPRAPPPRVASPLPSL